MLSGFETNLPHWNEEWIAELNFANEFKNFKKRFNANKLIFLSFSSMKEVTLKDCLKLDNSLELIYTKIL